MIKQPLFLVIFHFQFSFHQQTSVCGYEEKPWKNSSYLLCMLQCTSALPESLYLSSLECLCIFDLPLPLVEVAAHWSLFFIGSLLLFCEVSRDFCGLKRVCWDKDYLLFIIPNTFVRTFWSWEQCVIRGSCIAGTLPESMQIIFQIWKEVMGPSKHFSFSQLCQMGQWKLLLFPIKQSTGRFPNLLIKTHCKLTE